MTPSPTGNGNHGNACAGVIAATMNNNQGIAGIAPECRIMPIRLPDNFDPDVVADAIEFAVNNGANILSNSWGYLTADQNAHPVIVTAINYALNNNRVVIFSAGNNARHYSCNDNGFVAFPANVNIPGVITVGASDRNDNQADYSPTSSLIDIVAPSHKAYPPEAYSPYCGGISGETFEMWSIDIPDNTGYNPWPADGTHPPTTGEILPNTGTNYRSYTGRFGGTSHSSPVVAGVAALILSVNPDLSYIDVFNILTSTADKVGGFTYSNGRCNQMGYGRVNAYDAVLEAAGGGISGPSSICITGSTFSIDNIPVDSIVWSCGPYAYISSGQNTTQCTIYPTANGGSWVGATLYTDCGEIDLPHLTVSAVYPSGTWEQYSQSHPLNTVNFVQQDSWVNVAVSCPQASSFNWQLQSGSGISWNQSSSYGYSTMNLLMTSASSSSATFRLYSTTSACGTVNTTYTFVKSYMYAFTMAPNPASNEITVTRVDKNQANSKAVLSPRKEKFKEKEFNRLRNVFGSNHTTKRIALPGRAILFTHL